MRSQLRSETIPHSLSCAAELQVLQIGMSSHQRIMILSSLIKYIRVHVYKQRQDEKARRPSGVTGRLICGLTPLEFATDEDSKSTCSLWKTERQVNQPANLLARCARASKEDRIDNWTSTYSMCLNPKFDVYLTWDYTNSLPPFDSMILPVTYPSLIR